jgi:hypothetical protein
MTVPALLRPLVRTAGMLLAVAFGALACLFVLVLVVRAHDAQSLPPLWGAAAFPSPADASIPVK